MTASCVGDKRQVRIVSLARDGAGLHVAGSRSMAGLCYRPGAGLCARRAFQQIAYLPSLQRHEHPADKIERDQRRSVWFDEMTFGKMRRPP
jgi:hypothetical protein